MPSKRDVLSLLSRQDLTDFADNYGPEVADRRTKEALVEALASARKAKLDEMLGMLSREQLKELCRGLGLDDGGVEKAVIIERILGQRRPQAGASRAASPGRARRDVRRSAPMPSAAAKSVQRNATSSPVSTARTAEVTKVPPAVATLAPTVLDRILALQFLVAWAGEGRSEPRRFGWWDTDLVDPDGGGDLLERLLPCTSAWASLELVREAARSVDTAARAKHGWPDRLRTIFFLGFDADERLGDRLRALKREGRRPEQALPLPFALGAAFDPEQVSGMFASGAGPARYEHVPPVGRQLKGPVPVSPDELVQKLTGALVPPADHYPLPFFRLEG